MIQIDRADPELGTVRRCVVCGEDWPLDLEFFPWSETGRYLRRICRACHCEADAARKRGPVHYRVKYETPTERREADRARWRRAQHRHRNSSTDLEDKSLPGHARASENQGASQLTNGGASMSVTQR